MLLVMETLGLSVARVAIGDDVLQYRVISSVQGGDGFRGAHCSHLVPPIHDPQLPIL